MKKASSKKTEKSTKEEKMEKIDSSILYIDPNKPKTTEKKKRSWWKLALAIFGYLSLVGFLTVAGLFLYYMKDLPNPSKMNNRVVVESTKIYDRTGQHLLYEIHGEEKRTVISGVEMPDAVQKATIVLEDQGFYSHYGVDIRGILRAILKDVIKGGAAQGGSTITQQLVKNSILTSEKRLSRKIKELILAIEVEQKFSKDEILQMYLNEIPYGSNAYGIEAAAQTFFGKSAKDLTLGESALLACLPNAPTRYSPYGTHTDQLLYRWKMALDKMAELGYITPEMAEETKNEDILSQVKPALSNITAPHFVMFVKEQLAKEFGEEEIEKNGYKVYTTLDWDLQQIAEKAVKEGVDNNGSKYGFANAGLVAINPRTGQILAMVGSKDYFGKSEPAGCISGKNCTFEPQDNIAVRSRQPGSSFKPYVYAEAFTKGYTPNTILFDVDIDFSTNSDQTYNPKNYDNRNRGPVKMKEALSMSLNVPAVETLYLAGVRDSIDLARNMGITTLNNPDNYGLSLVLGGGEVKLVDHVSAFGVFANKGYKNEFIIGDRKDTKTAVIRIEDPQGTVLKKYDAPKSLEALNKNVALQLCDILSNNDLRTPVFGAHNSLVIPGHQVAAKTGTTNKWRDGWLVGATPSLATGVWTGNNDGKLMAEGADGSYVAGPIWNKFMTEALKNEPNEEFEKPEEVITNIPILDGNLAIEEEQKVCKKDGDYCLLDGDSNCSDDDRKKRKVFNAHSILYYVKKSDPTGEPTRHPEDDPQFNAWEKAVQKWAEDKAEDKDLVNIKKCK